MKQIETLDLKIKTIIIISFFISLTACTSWFNASKEEANPYKDLSAQQLFTESEKALSKEQYDSATKKFEALESMYPFSDFAEKAQLELIYAYYKKNDYPTAAVTAQRFIHLYPRAKNVDYAYYMKALANFQQSRGTFAAIIPMDESWRDSGTQSQAFSDFATLVEKFPNSRYKANSLQRMIYLRNMFAKRELNIANYYFERKRFVACAERASYLIKTYPQSSSAQNALSLLYYSNKALGLKNAAADVLAVYTASYHGQPMLGNDKVNVP